MAGQTLCGGQCTDTNSDPVNCGACGHDCLGGACAMSACQPTTLATLQDGAAGIALDTTRVYWASPIKGTVSSIAKAGGTVAPLASGQAGAAYVAVDGVSVYFTTFQAPSGTISKVPLAGGAPTVLTATTRAANGIATDGGRVYWVDFGAGTGAVSQMSVTGAGVP